MRTRHHSRMVQLHRRSTLSVFALPVTMSHVGAAWSDKVYQQVLPLRPTEGLTAAPSGSSLWQLLTVMPSMVVPTASVDARASLNRACGLVLTASMASTFSGPHVPRLPLGVPAVQADVQLWLRPDSVQNSVPAETPCQGRTRLAAAPTHSHRKHAPSCCLLTSTCTHASTHVLCTNIHPAAGRHDRGQLRMRECEHAPRHCDSDLMNATLVTRVKHGMAGSIPHCRRGFSNALYLQGRGRWA